MEVEVREIFLHAGEKVVNSEVVAKKVEGTSENSSCVERTTNNSTCYVFTLTKQYFLVILRKFMTISDDRLSSLLTSFAITPGKPAY